MASNQTEVTRTACTVGVPRGKAKWPVRSAIIFDFRVALSDQEHFYGHWMRCESMAGLLTGT